MSQTWLRYGDTVLKNVLVKSWSQEAVYDDSNTDLVRMRHVISVEGYFVSTESRTVTGSNPTEAMGIWQDSNATGIADFDQPASRHILDVRGAMLQPRQEFRLATGVTAPTFNPPTAGSTGDLLLYAAPQPSNGNVYISGFDVHNGPRPLRCIVTSVVAGRVFRVDYEIEVNVVECGPTNYGQGNTSNTVGILSNRWSVSDDIDRNFSTTRRLTGRLIHSNGLVSPHDFRGWVVPRLQAGFRRERMVFTASADGLQLDYEIVDQEVGYSSPYPATSWELRHAESIGDGKMAETSCSVSLKGPRDVKHTDLILVALSCVRAKCWRNLNINQYIITELKIADYYGDESHGIEISAVVQRVVAEKGAKDVIGNIVRFVTNEIGRPIVDGDVGQLIYYDSNLSEGAKAGDAIHKSGPLPITAAFCAYLQSPCNDDHAAGHAPPPRDIDAEFDAGVLEITERVVDQLPTVDETQISQSHYENPYTYYKVDSKYLTDDHVVGLPVASALPIASTGGGNAVRTQAFVLLAPPTTRRIVRIEAQRLGKQPEMPKFPKEYDYDVGGSQFKARRLSAVTSPTTPERQANGAMLYTILAEAQYGMETEIDPESQDIPIAGIPWLSGDLANAVLTPQAFSDSNTITSIQGNNGITQPA